MSRKRRGVRVPVSGGQRDGTKERPGCADLAARDLGARLQGRLHVVSVVAMAVKLMT